MLDEEARDDLVQRLAAVFTGEDEVGAAAFAADPDAYVAEHLPEGIEGADLAAVLPAVGEQTGLDLGDQAVAAADLSVVDQLRAGFEAASDEVATDGPAFAAEDAVDPGLQFGVGAVDAVLDPAHAEALDPGFAEGANEVWLDPANAIPDSNEVWLDPANAIPDEADPPPDPDPDPDAGVEPGFEEPEVDAIADPPPEPAEPELEEPPAEPAPDIDPIEA
jgi:hypothetical protein